MKITAIQATEFIIHCLKTKLTCMLSGSPGIGKSDIVKAIAVKFNLQLIEIRLSTYNPINLSGFPMVNKKGIASFIPMDVFPLENTPLPKGKAGWLIFLDEFNSASLSVQAAAYRFVLDHQVEQHNLHSKAVTVCAGNLATDGAIINRLSTAMESRMVHLELDVNTTEWLSWGIRHNIDHRVLSYIEHVPENLHKFNPKHDDKTFACPRTWHFVSRLIKDTLTKDLGNIQALLAGTVGIAAAVEFIAYTEIYTNLPTYNEILQDPMNARLDIDPSMLFAVSHMITAYLTKKDLHKGMLYIDRLPAEFQTITLQNLMEKDPSMKDEKVIQKWCLIKGSDLL
jgi:hypothetical protein